MNELLSYHLVGRFEGNDSVWIAPLDTAKVPETLSPDDIEVMKYLCREQGSVPCCTIRARQENELTYYHGYFSEPSPEDILAKDNALLRIIAAHRNPKNSRREAERIAEDVNLLRELGDE